MKFSSLVLCSAIVGSVSAFAPSAQQSFARSTLFSTTEEGVEAKAEVAPETPAPVEATAVINGSIEMASEVAESMNVAMPVASVPDHSRIRP